MAKLTEEDNKLKSKIKIRLNTLLAEKGWNQSAYAVESETDRQSVNRWVNDKNDRGISIYTINKFCKIIDVTLDYFFDDPIFK